MKPTVYQRIVRAAKAGKGLRLTAEEVWLLAGDGCVEQRAEKDDLNQAGSPDTEHL